ncbi:MAG: hypothetical protein AB8G05_15120 [Oligoflexales bacterium]
MRIFLIYRLTGLIFMSLLCMSACTDSEEDAASDSTALAGWVEPFSDGKATVSFANAEVDQEYLIMPYHLGSIDTVQGGDTSQSEYSVTLPSSANLRGFSPKEKSSARLLQPSDVASMGQIYRMIMNRFNRRKPIESQDDGLWALAHTYDELQQEDQSQLSLNPTPSMTAFLKSSIASFKPSLTPKKGQSLNLMEGCPTTDDDVELFVGVDTDDDEVSEQDSIEAVIENDDFCVILVTDSLSDKLSDKTVLESTIKNILDIYKNVIYEDTFPVKNGITFKPYFIFANFEDLVGLGHSSALTSIIGAFNQDLTVSAGRPVLLMTETLAGVGLGETDANVRQYWGTLAHEVSHAISYYYKNGLDDLYIDEGAAHVAEDLFGYKNDGNYENYASIYLQNRYSGNYPFFVSAALTSSDSSLDSYGRAAGQSLLHYLMSQKGGISYTDGALSASAGLKFYADVIKSPNKGIKNIRTVYADTDFSWLEIVGNYIGALMLDGTSLDVASRYQTADVIANINNVQGDSGKEYGYKFNGGELENATDNATSLDSETFEISLYQTKPFVYKVQSTDDSIEIETLAENAGVSVVRFK